MSSRSLASRPEIVNRRFISRRAKPGESFLDWSMQTNRRDGRLARDRSRNWSLKAPSKAVRGRPDTTPGRRRRRKRQRLVSSTALLKLTRAAWSGAWPVFLLTCCTDRHARRRRGWPFCAGPSGGRSSPCGPRHVFFRVGRSLSAVVVPTRPVRRRCKIEPTCCGSPRPWENEAALDVGS